MARIICLANSYKHFPGRCIAGIDIDTGLWVRPVPQKSGAIYDERFIAGKNGNEPNLMDVIELPLGGPAPDEGCQPENRYLSKGVWKRLNKVSVDYLSRHVEKTENLLHNKDRMVDPELFSHMPRSRWKSLQLICVSSPVFYLDHRKKKKCMFRYSDASYELKVTDPAVISKIENGDAISKKCLLTISMATPFKTPAYDKSYCWKMVAGVIEM